jgi:hypothetical protein
MGVEDPFDRRGTRWISRNPRPEQEYTQFAAAAYRQAADSSICQMPNNTAFGFTTNRGSLNFTGSALPQSGAIQVLTPELASLDRELFPPKATANGSRGEGPLALTDSELPEHARHTANG